MKYLVDDIDKLVQSGKISVGDIFWMAEYERSPRKKTEIVNSPPFRVKIVDTNNNYGRRYSIRSIGERRCNQSLYIFTTEEEVIEYYNKSIKEGIKILEDDLKHYTETITKKITRLKNQML